MDADACYDERVPTALNTRISKGVLVILYWLMAVSTPLQAGERDWFARVWQTDEGLPDNYISGVAQTSDGFLWVGTSGGLLRFDGTRFKEFSPVNLGHVP